MTIIAAPKSDVAQGTLSLTEDMTVEEQEGRGLTIDSPSVIIEHTGVFTNKGSLTLSTDGKGTYQFGEINNDGTMTINQAGNMQLGEGKHITNSTTGTLEINNSTLNLTNDQYIENHGELTISGGEIIGTYGGMDTFIAYIIQNKEGSTTIENGAAAMNISNAGGSYYTYLIAVESGNIILDGGRYTCPERSDSYFIKADFSGTKQITLKNSPVVSVLNMDMVIKDTVLNPTTIEGTMSVKDQNWPSN